MNNYKSFLMYKLKEVLVICKKKGEILLHWNSNLLIAYECKYKRGVGSRGLSLRHSYCLGTYSSYKDSTRPPPYSTQDEATEGCSAVWDHSNKLLPQSGPDEAFFFLLFLLCLLGAYIKVASVSCCWVLGWNEFFLCLHANDSSVNPHQPRREGFLN